MSVEAVGHELKLSVRGDKRDCAVVLEARQTHALVELHILQLHGFTLPSCPAAEEEIDNQSEKHNKCIHGVLLFGEMFFARLYTVYDCCTQ